ncbi:crossover junction endodeoxyribonuclease RuvC [Algiphilus sp. W345]|uniref:Crossover junction endodeoxyribonuclease RuvC n=1 Tax=Banduia mediterranea TaxID=3075609 RepID=A0ABU2WLC6_9GAMM|nr:crossover junction endodeoxyribonuclease RuvC [Algiphilus sp. W345]MDT0498358.1 crossover junction endodeoxyribonuclease RuvC [Algiphilus sp. W345]
MARILGIDPGSRLTGYGLILTDGPRTRHLAHGVIRCGDGPLPRRLTLIFRELSALLLEHQPDQAAVEQVFVNRNVQSALTLGQARGAAVCALGMQGLEVSEYAPAEIKRAIVGRGRAEKVQVQHMVRVLLNLDESPAEDASDALAVALCHAHVSATQKHMPVDSPALRWRRR